MEPYPNSVSRKICFISLHVSGKGIFFHLRKKNKAGSERKKRRPVTVRVFPPPARMVFTNKGIQPKRTAEAMVAMTPKVRLFILFIKISSQYYLAIIII